VFAYLSSMPQAGAILSKSSLAPYFSVLSHKRHNVQKKVTEDKTCILTFSTIFICNTSHPVKNSARHCQKCKKVFM
jgi:hypothetical protein